MTYTFFPQNLTFGNFTTLFSQTMFGRWFFIVPMSKPIIVYAALMAFISPWSDFIFAKKDCPQIRTRKNDIFMNRKL